MRAALTLVLILAVSVDAGAETVDSALERSRALSNDLQFDGALAILDSLFAADQALVDGEHRRAVAAWHLRANILYFQNGASTEVGDALQSAVEASASSPDPEDPVSNLEYEYGYVQLELGALDLAAKAWRQAIAQLLREGDDLYTRLWWQSDLAEVYRRQGAIESAENLLSESVAASRAHLSEANDDLLVLHAILLNNLGALLWDQNRLLLAESLYRESLAMSERLAAADLDEELLARAHQRLVTAKLNLGVVLRDQEKLDDARTMHESAVNLAVEHLDVDDQARIYAEVELGNTLDRLDEHDSADAHWDAALARLSDADNEHRIDRAELQNVRSRSLLARGEIERASAAIDDAVRLARASVGEGHPLLGWIYATRAQVVAASDRKNPAAIIVACNEALGLLEGGEAWPSARAETLVLRGHALHASGRAEDAIASIEAAWEIVERLRPERGTSEISRHRFMREFAGDASALIGWHVDRGEYADALGTAERFRSRLLQDELRLDRVDLRAGIAPDRLDAFERREASTRARIAAAQRDLREGSSDAVAVSEELNAAVAELRTVEDEIRLASPVWLRTMSPGVTQLDLDAFRREEIATGEAILYFATGEASAYAFLIPPLPEAIEAFVLEKPADDVDIEEQSLAPFGFAMLDETVRGVIGMRPAAGPAAASPPLAELELARRLHELFDALIPVELWQRVKRLDELTIVPDGRLFSLPFEALVVEPPSENGIRYWLDEGPALRYAPGLAAVAAHIERAEHSPSSLAVLSVSEPDFGRAAIPSLHGRRLTPLPGTARESEAIASAFAGQPAGFLRGAAATEKALRRRIGDARYLHIATHGLVDRASDSRLAALALTPGSDTDLDDDGLLQLFEIYDLDLSCELAVLSACDTRSGERLEGEAAHALSRGFHVAGARQVIASLWPVDDRSTATLIGELFGDLAEAARENRPADAAQMLRDAKLVLRNDSRWAHPVHWAPFLLSGRARPSRDRAKDSP
jgi:CHAT domain-containing protein/tetratricopeptide (TPR) repeat protein